MISRLLQRAILGVARVIDKAAEGMRRVNEARARRRRIDHWYDHETSDIPGGSTPPSCRIDKNDPRIN
jgi:hypothetical protein